MFIDPLSCIQVAGSQYDYVWAAVHCPLSIVLMLTYV